MTAHSRTSRRREFNPEMESVSISNRAIDQNPAATNQTVRVFNSATQISLNGSFLFCRYPP
jgi:hypothetical protein